MNLVRQWHEGTRKYVEIDQEIPDDVELEDNVYNEESLTKYCFCRKTDEAGGHYVMCSREDCKIAWYYLNCLKLKRIPKGKWECLRCKSYDHWCICGRKGRYYLLPDTFSDVILINTFFISRVKYC